MSQSPEITKIHFQENFSAFQANFTTTHGKFLEEVWQLEKLTNALLTAAKQKLSNDRATVIFLLSHMTAVGFAELLFLARNGFGLGAMKISRGMFESALYATYLRKNPKDIKDYLDFGHIIRWKRYLWLSRDPSSTSGISSTQIARLQKLHNRVSGRFTRRNGSVRQQWHSRTIADMAKDVQFFDTLYEMQYSIAASIHHANYEGMGYYLNGTGGESEPLAPPSMNSVSQALVAGHGYLLQSLETLNGALRLCHSNELKKAASRFKQIWLRGKNQRS